MLDGVLGFFEATSRLISINWLVSIGYTKVTKANSFNMRPNYVLQNISKKFLFCEKL